jgi:hypothetical protein
MPAPPILRSIGSGVERLVDRALCVVGAVLFSQLPEFMQQYLQRLEGHLDEARLQLERFRDAASRSGMTLDQLIAGAGQNPDPAMGRLGGVVRQALERVGQLGSADDALRHASAWSRPFVFAAHVDWAIARATWAIYRPAVPTTAEGLAYAGMGIVLVLGAYHLGVRAPVAAWARRRGRPPAPGPG